MNILVTVQLMLQKLIQCRFQVCRATEKEKKDLKHRYSPSVIAGRLPFFYRPRGTKEIC